MAIETTSEIISDEEATEMIGKLVKWADKRLDTMYPSVDRNAFALMKLFDGTQNARLNLNLQKGRSQQSS